MEKDITDKGFFDELIGFLYGCNVSSGNDIYENYAERLLDNVTYEENNE